MDDEAQIRSLIQRWAEAVHRGDIDGVLADHADDIVMFGTAEELSKNPSSRLRLTLGLRRENGRWVVAHEHHSFPHD
jgi:ketosteroid isomerase-like protein